jgi:hypothetical protein
MAVADVVESGCGSAKCFQIRAQSPATSGCAKLSGGDRNLSDQLHSLDTKMATLSANGHWINSRGRVSLRFYELTQDYVHVKGLHYR